MGTPDRADTGLPRKVTKRLSARTVATAAPGRHADGGGLYLLVKPTGARSWLFRATFKGRRRDFGLGGFPEVSLAKARDKADALRAQLDDGKDPVAERAKAKAAGLTFRQAAKAYIDAKGHEWRNDKHRRQWTQTLETYAHPVLGDLDVADIETTHVLAVLEPIWATKTETARRTRQRIEAVLNYAKAIKARTGENPAAWQGNLDAALAAPKKVSRPKHHAALPWKEVGAFYVALAEQKGMGALALRFAILTAARSGEVRGAAWDEIDLDERTWTIPAERMKAGRPHRVPLSDAAIEVVRFARLHGAAKHATLVFPGDRAGKPLSDMTLTGVLRRMGRDDLTVHGFRSTFRDWVSEATSFGRDIAEAALAHVVGDETEAAYRRGDLFAKRRKLMAHWANHCARTSPTAKSAQLDRLSSKPATEKG